MAMTSSFNHTSSDLSRKRVVTSEASFIGGMQYTDSPLSEGYSNMLINYQLANDGVILKPRNGFKCTNDTYATLLHTAITQFIDEPSVYASVHHVTQAYVKTADELDARLARYSLFGFTCDANAYLQALGITDKVFVLNDSVLTVHYKNVSMTAVNDISTYTPSGTHDTWFVTVNQMPKEVHDMPFEGHTASDGVFATLDCNTYLQVIHTWVDAQGFSKIEKYLGTLYMKFNALENAFTWHVKKLNAKDITAVQAVNYGYNMLSESPYNFKNTLTATGGIVLDGIIPYDANNNLITSARAGAEIFFHLIYRYPQQDVDNAKKYLVQWELQDLDSNSDTIVLQQVRQSQVYQPGDDIYFRTTQTTYKRFALICKIYYKDIVDAREYADTSVSTEINDAIYLTPDQVVTLAYYYLTDDSSTSTLNIDAVKYDLSTATGMCSWQQRVVMWGVKNAKSTLWVSEINNPTWFPYPNNCEIFSDDIVACIVYKANLLVFTKSALYQISLNTDGLTYRVSCIQERLTLEEADASSVMQVQNMLFFKNGNYYYMVVPVSGSTAGDLQLAPITRPLTRIFDNFSETMLSLIKLALNSNETNVVTIKLYDWWCNVEQKTAKIHYKFLVTSDDKQTIIDTVFNYNSQMRAWTTDMYTSTSYRMVAFIPSVLTETVYIAPRNSTQGLLTVSLSMVQAQSAVPTDDIPLDTNMVKLVDTFQYLDTGYRNISPDIRKRFRMIKFYVTNLTSSPLSFYSMFRLDNDFRKQMYTYETTTITDPEAPDYGTVYVTPTLEEPNTVSGLESHNQRLQDTWGIDPRRFPDLTVASVSVAVSGKGKLGRFMLRSSNSVMYEITRIGWVYRSSSGR